MFMSFYWNAAMYAAAFAASHSPIRISELCFKLKEPWMDRSKTLSKQILSNINAIN